MPRPLLLFLLPLLTAFGCLRPDTAGQAVLPGRELVWADEFDGKRLDTSVWNFELGDGGWGNNERQTYTRGNQRLDDGRLIITARREGDGYTSSRITTRGRKEFQYGRIEARAKLPVGRGIWPAFWMLGQNIGQVGWPMCGEIDVLEYVGREPRQVYTTLHTKANHGGNASSKKTAFPDIEEGFHRYAVEWTPAAIDFFVDDQPVYTFAPEARTEEVWPFDQPFYILLNVAVGGNFGGAEVDDSIFPQEFVVDYVRVYATQ